MTHMLQTAFSVLGTPVTWLEVAAFALSLACVIFETLEIHWAWPLAIVSSGLYGWLFYASRLYGDMAVQAYFVASSGWGWWEWLFGRRAVDGDGAAAPLRIVRLTQRHRATVAALWLLLWPLVGLFLARFTDTDVPYFDAFPTTGSLIGQVLLARKYVESWPVWLLVNVVSIALYQVKALHLTALLYIIFAALALVGWRRWARPSAG